MRIAILNRQRAAYPGGDLVLIDAIIPALRSFGHEAVYAPEGWTIEWLQQFDLVHIFHCNFGWSRYNFERTWQSGVPYVVSPIFYPDDSLGMSRSEMWTALNEARAVLPNSKREAEEMDEWFNGYQPFTPFNTVIVPNGTEMAFHADPHPYPSSRFVLHVTARPDDKNEAMVSEACARAEVPLSIVTGRDRASMPAVYRTAAVFVNASPSDRMSLTIGEALCSGCRVIATSENRGNEWYGPGLEVFRPQNGVAVLAAAIKRAINPDALWDYSPNRAARRLTIPRVAKMLSQVYRDAIR